MWCLAGASLEGVGELVWVLLVEVFLSKMVAIILCVSVAVSPPLSPRVVTPIGAVNTFATGVKVRSTGQEHFLGVVKWSKYIYRSSQAVKRMGKRKTVKIHLKLQILTHFFSLHVIMPLHVIILHIRSVLAI